MVVIRRRIAKDNNCLFNACAYLCENRQGSICTELRAAVAEHVRKNADIDEVMLGMPVEEYCTWIKNEMNWGGENEICFLCERFNVEIQVVMIGASSSALTYGFGSSRRGRIYLLYTGQHYDAAVGGETLQVMPADETKIFALGSACQAFDAQVVEAANGFFVADAKEAARCVKTMLKCSGCGALCDDTAQFQAHCSSVEHDDDFAYDCSTVEIEVEPLAEGQEHQPPCHSFYHTTNEPLSSLYTSPFTLDGVCFVSVEHYLQWSKYSSSNPQLAADILACQCPLQVQGMGEYGLDPRGDWEEVKEELLQRALAAKFSQHLSARNALLETGEKALRLVGGGRWLGVDDAHAGGGVGGGGQRCRPPPHHPPTYPPQSAYLKSLGANGERGEDGYGGGISRARWQKHRW